MSDDANGQEPTMEEILASIRKIISEDDGEGLDETEKPEGITPGKEPEFAPDDDSNSDDEEEVLELTEVLSGEEATESQPAQKEEQETQQMPEPEPETVVEPELETVEPELETVEPEPETVEPEPETVEPEPETAGLETHSGAADVLTGEGEAPVQVEDDIAFSETGPETFSEVSDDGLLSENTETATAAAFGALASNLVTSSGDCRTLEDLVAHLLKPMLKDWLDANLPPLVEQLVREEIERVARRRF